MEESFLSRWSRRKLQPKVQAAAADTASAVPGAQIAASTEASGCLPGEPVARPELPPVESLDGLRSDYQGFLHPQVDEGIRRTALKKLFSDPHFNVMDGLDTYIDDYSKPDPIPAAMLRQLHQAKALFLFDDEETAIAGGAPPAGHAGAAAPPGDAGAQAELPADADDPADAGTAADAVRLRSTPGAAS